VGRRLVLAEPRRLAAGALAVGLALMLVLLFQGLWTGVQAQVTVYEDKTGADLFVLAPGASSLFSEGSTLPMSTVDTVRATPEPPGRHRCAAGSASWTCTARRSR